MLRPDARAQPAGFYMISRSHSLSANLYQLRGEKKTPSLNSTTLHCVHAFLLKQINDLAMSQAYRMHDTMRAMYVHTSSPWNILKTIFLYDVH